MRTREEELSSSTEEGWTLLTVRSEQRKDSASEWT